MSYMLVHGGRPLMGHVTPVANKNSILKLIPAALLTDEDVIIHNVPTSSDVLTMLEILGKLGGSYEWMNDQMSLKINCSGVNNHAIDPILGDKIKASAMYLWPLLLRLGRASMPTPQWCKLGTRPMDAFIEGMVELGASYMHAWGEYLLESDWLQAKEIRQWFPSVTATENLIITATKVPGTTVIYNAACEPHTQDLCHMLVAMGAKIEGIGSNRVIVTGVESLKWVEWTVVSDHLDVGGLIAAAIMTGGEITIHQAATQHMGIILQVFGKMGVKVVVDREADTIFVPREQHLVIEKTVKWDPLRVHALQWPLLPPDFIHTCAVLALKAEWVAIFDNLMYEYGWFFVQEIAKMKGQMTMMNPVSVMTSGPTQFQSAYLVCTDIIQASYALLLAAMAAPGTSKLVNYKYIFRRFPDIVEQFNRLGAKIEIVED